MHIPLRDKILFGYFILMAVIASMAAIFVHERERIREIESEDVLLLTASDISYSAVRKNTLSQRAKSFSTSPATFAPKS